MIDFLKKYSLPYGLKRVIKRNSARRLSSGYAEAKSVLLFFTSGGNQKIALLKGLQNKMEKEGKSVVCLYLLLREEDKPDVHMDDGMEKLEPNDFSLFGNIEKPEVQKILNEEFDYMIHADMDSTIYTDLVMAKSKAKCRIGKYFEGHESQYDMMVKVTEESKITHLIDQIYYYTKAL
jgi:hypothetical protein